MISSIDIINSRKTNNKVAGIFLNKLTKGGGGMNTSCANTDLSF